MVPTRSYTYSLLESLSQTGWLVTEQKYSKLSNSNAAELWIDHEETTGKLNIGLFDGPDLPIEIQLIQGFDTSLGDFEGEFGTELSKTYERILSEADLNTPIEPIITTTTIAKARLEDPDAPAPTKIGTDFDTITRKINDFHYELLETARRGPQNV